jgi:membrane fusion protein, multidrug efflux system
MKQINIIWLLLLVFASCGDAGKKEKQAQLTELKKESEDLKKQRDALSKRLSEIDEKMNALDSTRKEKPKLIIAETVGGGNFTHSIDLQGKVEAENIVNVSPKYGPSQVNRLMINKGSNVSKGQPIMELNTEPYRKNKEVIITQLETAKDLLRRQENLWKQNIGSEVQVISARTQVETLEKNIEAINEQIRGGIVYAPISGVVDVLNLKVGETFGASPFPQVQIINKGSMKLAIEVPENYLAKITVGATIQATFPDLNQTVTCSVTRIGQSINQFSRSFTVEAALGGVGASLKPNQIAIARIIDYATTNAIVVPINVVQTDEKGKFIMVANTAPNGKMYAHKKQIFVGNMYGDGIEIKQGLVPGDRVITAGYQNLFENQLVSITQ